MIEEYGSIYADDKDRKIYFVLPGPGEAYMFDLGTFHQILTKYAERGCNLRDIEDMILPEEAEGLK